MKTRDNRALALKLCDQLLQMITDGTYPPGSRFPPERRLAELLNASRPTVREALRILEEEGHLTRRVGVGTYVNKVPVVETGLESLLGFSEMLKRSGHTAGTSFVRVSESEMTDKDREMFGVPAKARKCILERVRTLCRGPRYLSVIRA